MHLSPVIFLKHKKIYNQWFKPGDKLFLDPIQYAKNIIKKNIKLITIVDIDYKQSKRFANFDIVKQINSMMHTQIEVYDIQTIRKVLAIDARPIYTEPLEEFKTQNNFLLKSISKSTRSDFNEIIYLQEIKELENIKIKNKKTGIYVKKQVVDKIGLEKCIEIAKQKNAFFCSVEARL